MKINFTLFCFAICSIFLLSCETTPAKEKENPLVTERTNLKEEVISIHDEMMPDWHASRKAQTKLKEMIKEETEQKNTAKVEEYETAHQQLEVVYKAMKDWMVQYKPPTSETSNEDAISYFKDQKTKVVEMKEVMIENLKEAKKVIDFKTTSI